MKKTEKVLLTSLAVIALAGGIFFAFQALANPPASDEEKALAEAGAAYGEKGHSEMKVLLKTVAESLSGEVDLSSEAQKHLFGEPRGCLFDSGKAVLGGQWFISSWITAPHGNLKDLRSALEISNPNLKGDFIEDENNLVLRGTASEEVSVKRIDSDTFEVILASNCYGDD